MANTFKSVVSTGVGTALTTVYTAPASTTTTVIGLSLANVATGLITVQAKLAKNGGSEAFLVKNAPVPEGGSLVVVGGDQKLVLQTGDVIKIQSSSAASVDSVLSMLELT